MKRIVLSLSMLFVLLTAVHSQSYYRLSGQFSIREIMQYPQNDSLATFLTMGHVDYDKNKSQVVYDISFPDRENWYISDSVFYKIIQDSIAERYSVPHLMNMLDFDMILSEYDHDFLFQQMGCDLEDVRQEGDFIYKLWHYPDYQNLDVFKYILVQSDNFHTIALAYMDKDRNIISKQFYEEYDIVDGLDMPHSIEQRVYSDTMTYVKKLILKDVSLNNQQRSAVFRNDLEFLPYRHRADKGNIREEFELLED